MAEYISKDKFIHFLFKEIAYFEETQTDIEIPISATLQSVVNEIKKFPSEDVQPMKWIPVTEKLPEEYKNVLCYYEYFRYGDFNCMFRTIDRGYYGNGIWGGEAGQGHKNKVLAWMPLPEPPKGVVNNG